MNSNVLNAHYRIEDEQTENRAVEENFKRSDAFQTGKLNADRIEGKKHGRNDHPQ